MFTSLPFFSSGILTRDMNITPQSRMLNIWIIHAGLVLMPFAYALPRTMAKMVSVSHRLKRLPVTSHRLTPLSSLLRIASGNAAPMVKRKNGNTRSTQVMPGTSGLNAYVGGGVWQWNIHAGRSELYPMFAQRIIAKIVMPLSMSMVAILLLGVCAVMLFRDCLCIYSSETVCHAHFETLGSV